MSKDQKMVTLPLELPKEAHAKLKAAAFIRGVSMKALVLEWIEALPEPGVRAAQGEIKSE
jgi:hypothetical protein